jgi:hypothetical protein
MLSMLTNWTKTTFGQVVVGGSILLLGLGHFGKGREVMDMSIPVVGISLGTVAGAVSVLVGITMLMDRA